MNNRTEYTIKRENGDKIIISVDYAEWKNKYRISSVGVILKGKRNVRYVSVGDDWSYRKLDAGGRNEYEIKKYLEVVTVDEIKAAALTAWERMKPIIEKEEDLYDMV
jgi:hypothetical protein